MRQLFSRPNWAVQVENASAPPVAPSADKEEDTFSRSKEAYAREEKSKAHAQAQAEAQAQAQAVAHSRSSEPRRKNDGNDGERSPKRRRTSHEDTDGAATAMADGDGAGARDDVVRHASPLRPRTPLSSSLKQVKERFQSPRPGRAPPPPPQPLRSVRDEPIVIDMSDEEDSASPPAFPPPVRSPKRSTSRAPESLRGARGDTPGASASALDGGMGGRGDGRGAAADGGEDAFIVTEEEASLNYEPDSAASAQLHKPRHQYPTTHTEPPHTDNTTNATSTTTTDTLSRQRTAPSTQPTPPIQALPDPIIHLLVHSPQFPLTRPLITKIRLSTRLKAVREAWLHHQTSPVPPSQHHPSQSPPPPSSSATQTPTSQSQGHGDPETSPVLPESAKRDIMLTFRGRRVFDFTTCRSLRLSVNAAGEMVLGGKAGSSEFFGGDDGDGAPAHVTMEAVTAGWHESEAERKEQEEAAHRRGAVDGIVSGEGGGREIGRPAAQSRGDASSANVDDTSTPAEPCEQIRIIIKAKNLEQYKLRVRPTTPISQILRIFRKYRAIPTSATLVLMFEGERLEEDSVVRDADIGDLDSLEVYVR